MMTAMCVGGGWIGGISAFLVLILLILAATALVKYLFTGSLRQGTP